MATLWDNIREFLTGGTKDLRDVFIELTPDNRIERVVVNDADKKTDGFFNDFIGGSVRSA